MAGAIATGERGLRSKVQILISQQHREGEVRYLTGLISQSKSVRFRPYATNCEYRIVVITPSFQVGDESSILSIRSKLPP